MYALNLKHSPEKTNLFGCRPILCRRAQATRWSRYRRVITAPPGSQTASSYATTRREPGERRAALLRSVISSMTANVTRGGQMAASRVMVIGEPQWLAMRWGNAH